MFADDDADDIFAATPADVKEKEAAAAAAQVLAARAPRRCCVLQGSLGALARPVLASSPPPAQLHACRLARLSLPSLRGLRARACWTTTTMPRATTTSRCGGVCGCGGEKGGWQGAWLRVRARQDRETAAQLGSRIRPL
jgi:hypothetical protein